ncbi:MAG: GGDEF domain-containing protein [Desulfovibrio sp.]|nr:GGDEF domain-containing protein [Desulfovibrio sp.]MBI4960797.1 GGDEF domain-containing protein [Desulfovibrio sp.]
MDFKVHFEQGADSEYISRLFDIERYAWMTLSYDMTMIVGSDGCIVAANAIWQRSAGYSREELHGKYLLEFMDYEDRELVLFRFQRLITSHKGTTTFAFRFRCSDGSYKRFNWNMHFSPEHDIIYCIVKDISDVKDFHHAAYHDTLTGLSNRLFLVDTLPEFIESAKRCGHSSALFMLDLDGFKFINDSMGHQAGDSLLQAVSDRLLLIASTKDYCIRLGGDEFIILENPCDAHKAEYLATTIIATINKPEFIDGIEVQVGASIGIALAPHDADTPRKLMTLADNAMYKAKHSGKNRFTFASSLPSPEQG